MNSSCISSYSDNLQQQSAFAKLAPHRPAPSARPLTPCRPKLAAAAWIAARMSSSRKNIRHMSRSRKNSCHGMDNDGSDDAEEGLFTNRRRPTASM
jgi:hypothetical protein